MMTRKDFRLIADALKNARATDRVVAEMASSLATTNPRFDRSRFIDAATYVEPTPAPAKSKRITPASVFSTSPYHAGVIALYSKAA